MEKLAETRFEVHDLLAHRWSPRAFSERAIEAEKLRSLFEAASCSAFPTTLSP
jgi:hypothetical protein